jgi:hypothetical protein
MKTTAGSTAMDISLPKRLAIIFAVPGLAIAMWYHTVYFAPVNDQGTAFGVLNAAFFALVGSGLGKLIETVQRRSRDSDSTA